MRLMTIAFLAAAFEWTTPPAAAQPVLAFSSFSISSDLNDQVFPGVAGGILLDFAHSWSSVGVHGDVFFSGVMPPAVAVRSDRSISFGTGPFGSSPLEGMRGESWRGQCWAAALSCGATDGSACGRASRITWCECRGSTAAFFGMDPPTCNAQFHGGRAFTGHQP